MSLKIEILNLYKTYVRLNLNDDEDEEDDDENITCESRISQCDECKIVILFRNKIKECQVIKSHKKKPIIQFALKKDLDNNDHLTIECYDFYDKKKWKLFGKYVMLLNQLKNENILHIDDFLIDLKTSKEIDRRISFVLIYHQAQKKNSEEIDDTSSLYLNLLETYIGIGKKDKSEIASNVLKLAEITLNLKQNPISLKPDHENFIYKRIIERYQMNNQSNRMRQNVNRLKNIITSWKVTVKIIQLKGFNLIKDEDLKLLNLNENVYCRIEVGDKKFFTTFKNIKSDLIFNETFSFQLENVKSIEALYTTIKISAYSRNSFQIFPKCHGVFQIDLGTIYNEPTQAFLNKWVSLVSLSTNIVNQTNEYLNPHWNLKCDLIVQTKGDKIPVSIETSDSSNDNELIAPKDSVLHKKRIVIRIKIKAEKAIILEKKTEHQEDSDSKNYIQVNLEPPCPYLIVEFSGIKKKLIVKENSNENYVEFIAYFPSLVRLIKLELYNYNNILLAVEYLDIDDISDYKDRFLLPELDPCFIDFFSEPYIWRIKPSYHLNCESLNRINISNLTHDNLSSTHEYLPINANQTNGKYVGRVLMSIESVNLSYKDHLEHFDSEDHIQQKEFVAFVQLNEINNIVSKHKTNINFKLCIGTEGHEEWNYEKWLKVYEKQPSNYSQPQSAFQLGLDYPFCLAYTRLKQCISLKFKIEDNTCFMHQRNLFKNRLAFLVSKIFSCNDSRIEISEEELEKIRSEIFSMCGVYTDKSDNCSFLRSRYLKILIEMAKLYYLFKNNMAQFNSIVDIIEQIDHLLDEPISIFPDLNIFMLCGNEPIGMCTIKSSDIIWSEDPFKRGHICNRLVYADIKSLDKSCQSENIARFRAYMCLCPEEEKDKIFEELRDGYELSLNDLNSIQLPYQLFYNEKNKYKLHVHLYEVRDVSGAIKFSDNSFQLDPYIKITLGCQIRKSQIKVNTKEEIIVIHDIIIYGDKEFIRKNPPEVLVELFNQESYNIRLFSNLLYKKEEFLGKCYTIPRIKENRMIALKLSQQSSFNSRKIENNSSNLKCYSLINQNESTCDIIAAFELIHFDEKEQSSPQIENIPFLYNIETEDYFIEILFWGLRKIKQKDNEKLYVQIAIGENVYTAKLSHGNYSNDNFYEGNQIKLIIKLPIINQLKPYLNIKCFERGQLITIENDLSKDFIKNNEFFKKVNRQTSPTLIGSHTIKSLNEYLIDEKEIETNYKNYLIKISRSDRSVQNFVCEIAHNLDHIKFKHFVMMEKKSKENEDDASLDYHDWWLRYYQSTNAKLESKSRKTIEKNSEDDFFEESTYEQESDISPESDSIPIKSCCRIFRNDKNKEKELVTETAQTEEKLIKKTIEVAKESPNLIKIYDCELENVSEFKNSFNFLKAFNLKKFKNDSEIQCTFKGNFLLYKKDLKFKSSRELDALKDKIHKGSFAFLNSNPPNDPVNLLINIYIIKAKIHKCDSHIFIKFGDEIEHEINDSEYVIKNSDEPKYGRSFRHEITLPYHSELTIGIKDSHTSKLIGKTVIDLENRFFSRCYSRCGLAQSFELNGINKWRDSNFPSEILFKLSKKWNLRIPCFHNSHLIVYDINGEEKCYEYADLTNKMDQFKYFDGKPMDIDIIKKELTALKVLHDWESITNCPLVPEHIETRSLLSVETEIEQGKIELWIDMFKLNNQINAYRPKAVDISLRKPLKYQLRVIIFKTEEVLLDDIDFITGEKSSDIYIRCNLQNEYDVQKTDVHYRSFNGEGKFNWRFKFDFEYIPEDAKIFYTFKGLIKSQEIKKDPILHFDVMDADLLKSDDILGKLDLDLTNCLRASKTSLSCKLIKKPPKEMYINLFKANKNEKGYRVERGWWAFESNDKLAGKMFAELQLLTEKQANEDPAGKGREGPQALEAPERPPTSLLWITSPMSTVKLIWKSHKCFFVSIIFVVIGTIFLLIFIYQLPSAIITELFNKIRSG